MEKISVNNDTVILAIFNMSMWIIGWLNDELDLHVNIVILAPMKQSIKCLHFWV